MGTGNFKLIWLAIGTNVNLFVVVIVDDSITSHYTRSIIYIYIYIFPPSQSPDKSNGSSQGSGPRQRAEALAALTSAFKSSPPKTSTASRVSGRGKGSQRAAAVAALSSVLTAEKKKANDSSPPSNSSPPPESNAPGKKTFFYHTFLHPSD